MKILHVMAGARAGGAETMMLDGVLALAGAGIAQEVVTRTDDAARLAELKAADVPTYPASFDRFWRFPTEALIKTRIRAFAPDVIHYWMGRAGTFAPAAQRAKSLGWYGGYYKLSRFRNCAWHAGVTPDIERHIVAQGAPAERVSTLRTFAAIEPAAAVARETFDTPADAPLILALARLHWKKGLDTLLQALAEIPGAYAWIAGDGPLKEELAAMARTLNVAGRVRFLGWRNDRAALLAACDIVAFPSRYEPFGTVTVEAWAAGKPLVVADAAGPAATVQDGEDALLIPKGDSAALADALRRVIADPALAAKLVANGRRAYEAGYTRDAFVTTATALYARIAAG